MNANRSLRSQIDGRPVGAAPAAAPRAQHDFETLHGVDDPGLPFLAIAPTVALVPDPPPVRGGGGWTPKALLAGADLLAVAAGLWLAYASRVRLPGLTSPEAAGNYLLVGGLSSPAWLLALARYRLFRARNTRRLAQEFSGIVHACAAGVAATGLIGQMAGVHVARGWLVLSLLSVTLALVIERAVARVVFRRLRSAGRLTRRIVVLGTDTSATSLVAALLRNPKLGYDVAGYLDNALPIGTTLAGNRKVLGRVGDAVAVVRSTDAQGVVIVPSALDGEQVNAMARELARIGIHVEVLSTLRGIAPERLTVGAIGTQFGVTYVQPIRRAGWRAGAKRAFDVVLAGTGLVLAAPLLAGFAIAVKLDSRGPVLFRQHRLGRDGVLFEVLKIRSMVVGAEALLDDLRHLNEADGPLFKLRRDPRVTRVGRVVRSMSLDELPQLWNVLRGEMSIVGPRPALPAEADGWRPELHQRLRVRPGITGMWQVNSRNGANFDDYVELDLYYVDNWSLPMDLCIVLRTVPSVLLERGAR